MRTHIHTYIRTYVRTYIHTVIHACKCAYIHAHDQLAGNIVPSNNTFHTSWRNREYVCMYVYVCMCSCMYACKYVHMYACVYVYM